MSEPEQLLPRVTLPAFQCVVTDLFSESIEDARPIDMFRFRAEGLSMYPAIRHGELITVGPVDCDQVVRGDVLLCRHSTQVLAHRVVATAGYGSERVLQLRGDAKQGCDAPVAARDVIGRVLSVRRNGRAITLCGRAARLRHTIRTAASRAKAFVVNGHHRLRFGPMSQQVVLVCPERFVGQDA
jgi:signal peptidase I